MGLPSKLFGTDEVEVLHTRTHAKVMLLPAVALVLVGAGVGVGAALIPSEWRPAGQVGIALLGLLLAIWCSVLPFLRWRTTTYTLTDRRLVARSGILNRNSVDVPLSRVEEVSSARSLGDRLLGCGTLQVRTASDAGVIALVDVPEVQHVHQTMTQLVLGAHDEHRLERA